MFDKHGGLGLTKVSRRVVKDGKWAMVECALRADGTSPAIELFDRLKEQMWDDPDSQALPDEYQASILFRLYAAIEGISDGEDPEPGVLEFLRNGIWQLNVASLRLTFYDTDGKGSCPSLHFVPERQFDGTYRLPDSFAEIIRLGHYFGKPRAVRRTPKEHLRTAFAVRKEDMEYDR